MQQSVDKDLIRRYLKDQCTPQERAMVRGLMESGAARELFDEVLAEGWDQQTAPAAPEQLRQWQSQFRERIDHTRARRLRVVHYLKYAAVLTAFVLGLGVLWVKHGKQTTLAMQETVNPRGKLLKVVLPDQTVITLNADSKLKYPATFSGKNREVFLEGEGFFEVAPDKEHPFIVHTAKVDVNVLGTSFNVSVYPDDSIASVAVATGKVGVLVQDKQTILLPGEQLACNNITGLVRTNALSPADISAWKAGMLICRNETLLEISRKLERRYEVRFVFKNKEPQQLRFNFKQKNDTLKNVMETLKFAGGINYEIAGNEVTIW